MKPILSLCILFFTASAAMAQSGCSAASSQSDIAELPDVPEQTGTVKSYLVTEDGAHRMTPSTINFDNGSTAVNGTITLNPADERQPIDGFGFAITGSAAYNLLKMNQNERQKLLTRIFSRDNGYGCSYVRVPIGCSDFSLSDYTCCDTPGIDNFALTDEETKYIIPVMKEILAINPDIKVITAPWTAPRWMKVDNLTDRRPYNEWTSGQLNPEHYGDYADYFVKWIKAFEDNGIRIYGMTPQNEPLNRGNSASMFMGWDEARDFIKTALGPKFEKAGLKTKIYVFDHNYNYDNLPDQQGYPTKIYADPEASKYITGAAYHNYGGNASEMTRVHDANPDKELIFTEWTAGTWSWPGVGMNAITSDARALIFDVVNNWGRGAVVWNLMLDSDRGPFRPKGCSTGNGAIDISKHDYSTLTYNSFYYVMCIAATAVSENARYITANGNINGVEYSAFRNNDGGYGLVVSNTSNIERNVRVTDGTHRFTITLPARSLASYRW